MLPRLNENGDGRRSPSRSRSPSRCSPIHTTTFLADFTETNHTAVSRNENTRKRVRHAKVTTASPRGAWYAGGGPRPALPGAAAQAEVRRGAPRRRRTRCCGTSSTVWAANTPRKHCLSACSGRRSGTPCARASSPPAADPWRPTAHRRPSRNMGTSSPPTGLRRQAQVNRQEEWMTKRRQMMEKPAACCVASLASRRSPRQPTVCAGALGSPPATLRRQPAPNAPPSWVRTTGQGDHVGRDRAPRLRRPEEPRGHRPRQESAGQAESCFVGEASVVLAHTNAQRSHSRRRRRHRKEGGSPSCRTTR